MRRRSWVLGAVMGFVHFAFHLFMRVLPPLIPVLAVELGFPLVKLGLLVGVYFAGSSVGLLPAGVLSDASDRRTTLTAGLVLVSLGYLVFVAAPGFGGSVPSVIVAGTDLGGPMLPMAAGMFVAGLGTSVHVPVGVPIITSNVGADDRGKVLGIWGGSSKVGDAATPAIVGVLILVLPWQDIVLGFALLGLVFAVVLFGVLSHGAFRTVPQRAVGGDHERAAAPWRGDRRAYLYPMLVLMAYFGAYQVTVQGVVTFTPTFVTDVYAYRFALAGIDFAPESYADFALSVLLLAGAASRFGAGVLVDVFDPVVVLIGTLAVAAAGLAVLTVVPLGPVALLFVLAAFGGALWGNSPARDSLISDLSPVEHEGRTFSYLWTASRVFGAGSPVLIGLTADTVGIRTGFGVLTVATVLAAASIALLLSDRVYAGTPRAPA